jgi:hypothetical protein
VSESYPHLAMASAELESDTLVDLASSDGCVRKASKLSDDVGLYVTPVTGGAVKVRAVIPTNATGLGWLYIGDAGMRS